MSHGTPELLRTVAGAKQRCAYTLRELIGRLERERLPLDCERQGAQELELLREALALLRRPQEERSEGELDGKLQQRAIAELREQAGAAAPEWEEVLGRP